MATTVRVNADDQHLESMNELARKFFQAGEQLLEGNLDLEDHQDALNALGSVSAELAELVGFMKADVARLVSA